MNSNSDVRPSTILTLGDGSFHYNYNIEEVEVENEDGSKSPGFNYKTVHIWGKPNYESMVKAVIRAKYDETQELSLINKYNSFVLGLSTDPEYKSKYKEYLTEVMDVKEMVKADLQVTNEEN